jgi:hypothetical protein
MIENYGVYPRDYAVMTSIKQISYGRIGDLNFYPTDE